MAATLFASSASSADAWNPIYEARCRQSDIDSDEDSLSTVADSETDEPSKIDLLDSEDEEEEEEPSTVRWADLVDSADEEEPIPQFTSKMESIGKPRWADLVESDEEAEHHGHAITSVSEQVFTAAQSTASQRHVSGSSHGVGGASNKAAIASSRNVFTDEPARLEWNATYSAGKAAGKGGAKGFGKAAGKDVGKGDGKGAGKGAAKGAGKGAGKSAGWAGKSTSKGRGKGANEKFDKLQCQFVIGIEEDSKFRVVRRIIGQGGVNMKTVAQKTGAKLRLRGRGSKFLEGPEQQESTDDLMLCISCQDKAGFETAKEIVSDLLKDIYHSYSSFCSKKGSKAPALTLQLHEGYREGSR